MTFAETKHLVETMHQIEVWVEAITREKSKDQPDYKEIDKLKKYLEQDRQTVFDIASK